MLWRYPHSCCAGGKKRLVSFFTNFSINIYLFNIAYIYPKCMEGMIILMAKVKKRRNRGEDATPQIKKTNVEKLEAALELPSGIFAGLAHLELSGNREAIIEGCKGVLEYDENLVRINTGKMIIRFLGRGLTIRNLTEDSAVIEGYITTIEYMT
jgi:sporulation protein YqfC